MTTKSILRELFSSNDSVKKKFQAEYGALLSQFAQGYLCAFDELKSFKRDKNDPRHASIEMFLLAAFNSILISTKLLILGLLVPAGNLMRHFAEAIAIAILCSSKHLDIHDRVRKESKTFPYHDALKILSKPNTVKLLQLDSKGVEQNKNVNNLYDKYSHASVFSLSSFYDFGKSNKPTLGVFFDEGKRFAYEKELKGRLSACILLQNAIEISREIVQRETKHSRLRSLRPNPERGS